MATRGEAEELSASPVRVLAAGSLPPALPGGHGATGPLFQRPQAEARRPFVKTQ